MDSKNHWETLYRSKNHKDVSWYADHIAHSLELIQSMGLKSDASLIDVGGGASTLAEDLLELGYSRISVLDVSSAALNIARLRLGDKASRVIWLETDLLHHDFPAGAYDFWHDRAVFHFLTEEPDRQTYRSLATRAIKHGGYLLMSVFSDEGPEKCSNIYVRRHATSELESFFEKDFEPVKSSRHSHITPTGVNQSFATVLLRKK